MSAIHHLTSLLIQVTPAGRSALLTGQGGAGVRLHQTRTPSKLIAMLEAADERTTARVAERLLSIQGVLTVSVITHLVEPAVDLDQEMGA